MNFIAFFVSHFTFFFFVIWAGGDTIHQKPIYIFIYMDCLAALARMAGGRSYPLVQLDT